MVRVRKKISSLSELDNTVKRLMFRHFPKLMNNKEAFDIGSRAILRADDQFNGTGSLGGFRSYCFKKSLSIFGKEPDVLCIPTEQLDLLQGKHGIDLNMDLFDFCKKVLSPLHYRIVEGYFINRMNYTKISVQENITLNKTIREFSKALDILSEKLDRDTYA
jgi:hypothetical protein